MSEINETRIIGRASPIARRGVFVTRRVARVGNLETIERADIETGARYLETYLHGSLLIRVRIGTSTQYLVNEGATNDKA